MILPHILLLLLVTTADPHSQSNPHEISVSHIDLKLNVNFENKVLTGEASLTLSHHQLASEIILDSRGLNVERVINTDGHEIDWRWGKEDKILGRALHIEVTPQTKKIRIIYRTTSASDGLLWLEPEQTTGKQKPFLLTQSQAIEARSWIPCQDSPQVRITYTAEVKVPSKLGLMVLMSASDNRRRLSENGVYRFKMNQSIPPYLFALAVGDLKFKKIGENTGIYAEPSVLTAASNEFIDLQNVFDKAEKIAGPHPYRRYDLLVLPPAFPYGGMENPQLSFVTPTLIAGDRSLVNVVFHELGHSWAGDNTTTATMNSFFLNEGLTCYLEALFVAAVDGNWNRASMLRALSREEAITYIQKAGERNPDTRLVGNYLGVHPSDIPSEISYEKGHMFFLRLEEILGQERLLKIIRKYFKTMSEKSITPEEMLTFFVKEAPELEVKTNLNEWIYAPGFPNDFPEAKSHEIEMVEHVFKAWTMGFSFNKQAVREWTWIHWIKFFNLLEKSLTRTALEDLEELFKFSDSKNAEIFFAWSHLLIKKGLYYHLDKVEAFLGKVGRGKFVRPLYEELLKNKQTRQQALSLYKRYRSNYFSGVQRAVDKMVKDCGITLTSLN